MTNRDNKAKNEWKKPGWSIGSDRPQEKNWKNPTSDNTRQKSFKDSPKQNDRNKTHIDHKTFSPANIGWLYYKDYYHGLEFKPGQEKDVFKDVFEAKNEAITSRRLSQYREQVNTLEMDFDTVQSFDLETQYPGMVTGLGASHETHREGEYKLGFHFDHTTGLPVIPGSSVKGVLRSAFQKSPKYIEYLLENPQGDDTPITGIDIDKLEKEIFDGERQSPYRRDVFFDAVIVSSENEDNKFLADDFITPHPDEFKDPVPLQFLKVLPRVVFRFRFRLQKGLISETGKRNLFERILKDLGIGAKTNVGYGKFK